MENYYNQKAELEMAKERLNSKYEEKKEIYFKHFNKRLDINIKNVIFGLTGQNRTR